MLAVVSSHKITTAVDQKRNAFKYYVWDIRGRPQPVKRYHLICKLKPPPPFKNKTQYKVKLVKRKRKKYNSN